MQSTGTGTGRRTPSESQPPVSPASKPSMNSLAMRRALARMTHEMIERQSDLTVLVLVGIKSRGVPLAHRLATNIALFEGDDFRPQVYELDARPFRDDIKPDSTSRKLPGLDVHDREVVLVDDVLFTGRTVRAAIDALIAAGRPASIRLAVLVDRGHRELPIRPDYIGKNMPTASGEHIQVCVEEYDGVDEVVRRHGDWRA